MFFIGEDFFEKEQSNPKRFFLCVVRDELVLFC